MKKINSFFKLWYPLFIAVGIFITFGYLRAYINKALIENSSENITKNSISFINRVLSKLDKVDPENISDSLIIYSLNNLDFLELSIIDNKGKWLVCRKKIISDRETKVVDCSEDYIVKDLLFDEIFLNARDSSDSQSYKFIYYSPGHDTTKKEKYFAILKRFDNYSIKVVSNSDRLLDHLFELDMVLLIFGASFIKTTIPNLLGRGIHLTSKTLFTRLDRCTFSESFFSSLKDFSIKLFMPLFLINS